jgi:hypothetical protein
MVDRLRIYAPFLPPAYSPVPVMKVEKEEPAIVMKDGWGVTYYIHPSDDRDWSLEAVTPGDTAVFQPISRDPSEVPRRVDSILGYRREPGVEYRDGRPYDLERMIDRDSETSEILPEVWGSGVAGRVRVCRPIMNGETTSWESYYVIHPEMEGVYPWRQS